MWSKSLLILFFKNFRQFIEVFDLVKTIQTDESLILLRAKLENLSIEPISGSELENIWEQIDFIALETVRSLKIYQGAPSKLTEAEVNDFEHQIFELLKQETFAEAGLNELVFKRMPTSLEPFAEEIQKPFIRDVDEDAEWCIDVYSPVKNPSEIEINVNTEASQSAEENLSVTGQKQTIELDSVLLLLEHYQSRTLSPSRYRKLLNDWYIRLQCDDLYCRRVEGSFPSMVLPSERERNDLMRYLYDRLEAFFLNEEGFSDIPNYFLHTIHREGIRFLGDSLNLIQQQISFIREGLDRRFTIEQLHHFQSMIQFYGDRHLKRLLREHRKNRLDILSSKRDEHNNPIFIVRSRVIVPIRLRNFRSIPLKKPLFFRWDKRQQYKIVQHVSDAILVLEAFNRRLNKMLQTVSSEMFQPSHFLALFDELLDECRFLEQQYEACLAFQSTQIKQGLFYSGTRKLARLYQGELLQLLNQLYERVTQIDEIVIERFWHFIDQFSQRTSCVTELSVYRERFLEKSSMCTAYLNRQETRVSDYCRQFASLAKRGVVTLNIFRNMNSSSSYSEIMQSLGREESFSYLQVVKSSSRVELLENQKKIFYSA